jgi:hypothetical protein
MNKQEFYVGRWLKALKYFGDEHGIPSLTPGDYIQIKEVVDGIGIGYKDGRKHLLFNTKYIDSYLSTNFELMPEDFTPTNINKNKTDMNKIYIVTNVELGWDNIVFVSFDKTEAEKCKNSWGDTCVVHTKRIEERFVEDW